jgi:molybdopterin synthase sulfur carrier subunit
MRVVVMHPLDRQFFGGRDRLELAAPTLFALVGELERESPGFAELADVRVQFAVDGVVQPDWSASLDGAEEVIVLPRVSGG